MSKAFFTVRAMFLRWPYRGVLTITRLLFLRTKKAEVCTPIVGWSQANRLTLSGLHANQGLLESWTGAAIRRRFLQKVSRGIKGSVSIPVFLKLWNHAPRGGLRNSRIITVARGGLTMMFQAPTGLIRRLTRKLTGCLHKDLIE